MLTDAASIGGIATLVRAQPPTLGTTRLVLVDGPGGSGKTTLAGRLAEALRGRPAGGARAADSDAPGAAGTSVQVLHADDMYEGWAGLPTLGDIVIDQVLAPMARGEAGRFRVWDWHRHQRGHEVVVTARDVLIIEGVGVAMRRARSLASLVVWVEADPCERLRRGIARDGEDTRDDWERWQVSEREEFEREGTRAAAHVWVDGNCSLPD